MRKRNLFLAGLIFASATLLGACQYNINLDSIRYNVDFYVDGEVYQSVGTDGKTIEMPQDPVKEGYQFNGWYTKEDGEGEIITLYTLLNQPLSEDIRLKIYADFLEELTVTYVTGTDETIANAEYLEGDTVSEVTLEITPENMLFNGWFTDEECTQKWDFETELSQDVTLYAGWISKYVTLTYDFNMEGVEDKTVQTVRHQTAEAFTPESTEENVFIGWYKDEKLTQEWSFTDKIESDLTLYAKWQSKYVTVTYDFQHETLENKTVQLERGSTADEITPDSIPPYHDFLGWHRYEYGYSEWDFSKPIDQDITLYASWNDHTGEYVSVRYVTPDGDTYYESGEIGSLLPPCNMYVPDGERFVGWFLDEECTQPWDIENDRADRTEITLYGKTELIYFNITFDTEGLGTIEPEIMTYESSITLPTLYKDDYRHTEWIGTIKKNTGTSTISVTAPNFSFTLRYLYDVHFTPVFKSIFEFEKIAGKDEYALTSITAPHQETVSIPSTYEGLPVTRIEAEACRNRNNFQKLIIPDSVTYIGEEAFAACYDLKEVVIGSDVTTIEYRAFDDCRALTKVTFTGNSLKTVANDVFFNTAIESLTLPDSVETFGGASYCQKLTSIDLGNVKTITGSFYDCTSLKEIRLPATLETLKGNVFDGCNLVIYAEAAAKPDGWAENWNQQNMPVVWNAKNVKTVTENGMTFAVAQDHAMLVRYAGTASALTVPAKIAVDNAEYPVTELCSNAFYCITTLVNLSLPNTLEKVGIPQFIGCNALTYYVENGVQYLGNAENPYLILKDLTSYQKCLTVPASTRIILGHSPDYSYTTYDIGGLTFEENSQLAFIGPIFYGWASDADRNVFLPAGVKYVAENAFSGTNVNVFVPEESQPDGWAYGWNAWVNNGALYNPANVYYGATKDTIVTVNEATYLLRGEEATLLKLECTTNTYALPDVLTVDGKEYTLTTVAPFSLSYTQADLIYLAIPETVTSASNERGFYPKYKINTYLVGSDAAPEGWTATSTNTFFGASADDYIMEEKAHYIAHGDYVEAYLYVGEAPTNGYTVFVVPKAVTVNGSALPVSHVSRKFISSVQYVSVLLQDSVTHIPAGQTYGYGTKFFTTHKTAPAGWEKDWNENYGSGSNKGYIPVTYGLTGFTETEKTYSFVTSGMAVNDVTASFLPFTPTTTLNGKYFWGWYDNAEFSGNPVEFPYMGESRTFYARFENTQIQDGKSYETAYELTLGSYTPVEIKTAGQTVYFKMTVETMQNYIFKSRGDCDTFGAIYQYNSSLYYYKQVASADSGGSGENFSLTYKLLETTYYFAVKLVDATQTGTFDIIVSIA